MPTQRTLQQSLVSGEIVATMFGRANDPRVQAAVAKCSNFIVRPQGSARTRPGTQHVDTTPNTSPLGKVRVIPFKFGVNQELVIALGNKPATETLSSLTGWLRFYSQGAPVLYAKPTLRYIPKQTIYTNASTSLLDTFATTNQHSIKNNQSIAFTQICSDAAASGAGLTYQPANVSTAFPISISGQEFKAVVSPTKAQAVTFSRPNISVTTTPTVVTLTTSAPHGLSEGEAFTFSGALANTVFSNVTPAVDRLYYVSVVTSPTTITFASDAATALTSPVVSVASTFPTNIFIAQASDFKVTDVINIGTTNGSTLITLAGPLSTAIAVGTPFKFRGTTLPPVTTGTALNVNDVYYILSSSLSTLTCNRTSGGSAITFSNSSDLSLSIAICKELNVSISTSTISATIPPDLLIGTAFNFTAATFPEVGNVSVLVSDVFYVLSLTTSSLTCSTTPINGTAVTFSSAGVTVKIIRLAPNSCDMLTDRLPLTSVLVYKKSVAVNSITLLTNPSELQFETISPHFLITGEQITFTHKNVTPSSVTECFIGGTRLAGGVYFAIPSSISGTQFKIASSAAAAIIGTALTGTPGTGTVAPQSTSVFSSPTPVTFIDAPTILQTYYPDPTPANPHQLVTGDPVIFKNFELSSPTSTRLPIRAYTPPIPSIGVEISNAGKVFYAVKIDDYSFHIASTQALALSNLKSSFLPLDPGRGLLGLTTLYHSVNKGDLVLHEATTTSINNSVYYCVVPPSLNPETTETQSVPGISNSTYWYKEPGNVLTVTFNSNSITCTGTEAELTNLTLHHGDPVTFSSTASTLPTELVSGTVYFVLDAASTTTTRTFKVSATPFGPALALSNSNASTNYALVNAVYECPHAFANADLMDLTYDQSNDIVSLAHQNYSPSELRRSDATQWVLNTVVIKPVLQPPVFGDGNITVFNGEGLKILTLTTVNAELTVTTVSAHQYVSGVTEVYISGCEPGLVSGQYIVRTAAASVFTLQDPESGVLITGAPQTSVNLPNGRVRQAKLSGERDNFYVVTSVTADNNESIASSVGFALCNLDVNGSKNTLSWAAVVGAERYRVYRKLAGLFGYIGQCSEPKFIDDNIDPDLGISPPILDSSLTKPSAVGHHDQRRVWAGTPEETQSCWFTKTGTESDLSFSLPVLESDRIKLAVASRSRSTIRHIISLESMLLLTDAAEYRVTPTGNGIISPLSVSVRAQSYVGSNFAHPVLINSNLIFASERGGHLFEIAFRSDAQSFYPGNLSLRAAHLFENRRLVDMAWTRAPQPVIWTVSNNGQLFGLTYVPEEQVGAWHQHSTAGTFESVAVITEGDEDRIYVVVKRDGVLRVERFASQVFTSRQNSFQVDAGVTFTGPATKVKGLRHLIGKTVSLLVDGKVQPQKIVDANGEVTLTTAASTIAHAGLPFVAQIDTLPHAMQIDAAGHSRQKNLAHVYVRVKDSAAFLGGSLGGTLWPSDPHGEVTDVMTGMVEITATGSWSYDGQATLQVVEPLPVEVTAIVLETEIGG